MPKNRRDSEAAYRARKLEERQRSEEARKRQKRARQTTAVVAFVVLMVVGVGLAALSRRSDSPDADAVTAAALAPLGVPATGAGCSDVARVTPLADWTNHVDGDWEYGNPPPSGGPHSARTLPMNDARFYSREDNPPPERVVHDLEHGLVIAWYDPDLPEAELAALRQVAAKAGERDLRFLAVPWNRGAFAGGEHVALTAWGVTQRCTRVSGELVARFVREHGDAKGLAERGLPV